MTRPLASISGAPELAASGAWSTWMTLLMRLPSAATIVCWSADTLPLVSVRSSPKGLPMVSVGSPTRTDVESPRVRGTIGSTPCMSDAQHRQVVVLVDGDDSGAADGRVLELDGDPLGAIGAVDDVVVGEDVAETVDEEAGAGGGLALAGVEEVERAVHLLDELGADEHDPGREAIVDLQRRLAGDWVGRLLGHQRRLVDDRLGVAAAGDPGHEQRNTDHEAAEHRRDEVRLQQAGHPHGVSRHRLSPAKAGPPTAAGPASDRPPRRRVSASAPRRRAPRPRPRRRAGPVQRACASPTPRR